MFPGFFFSLLAVVCAFAYWKGGHDERVVATTCLLGTLATNLAVSPLQHRYTAIESGLILVDIAVFIGFTIVALRTNRFWPLWVAGIQLTTVSGHLLKGLQSDLLPQAYGAALQLWSYPILVILGVGTWRTHRRWRDAATPT